MNIFQIELTKQEAKIYDEVMARIDKTVAYLASLSHTERINWLKEHQYSRPISFERKIGGTVFRQRPFQRRRRRSCGAEGKTYS